MDQSKPAQFVEPGVEARTAARWWANQLRRPPEMDNGDEFQSGFAQAAALFVHQPVGEATIDAFERLLAKRMQADLSAHPKATALFAMAFSTDYGPSFGLADAAKEAGIPEPLNLRFPIKTAMWAEPGRVAVAPGYGAATIELPLIEDTT